MTPKTRPLFDMPPTHLPLWFNAGKNTPKTHIDNVRRGAHPMGLQLTQIEGATCGNCANRRKRSMGGSWFKCAIIPATRGPGTDIRLKWRGCSKWEADE